MYATFDTRMGWIKSDHLTSTGTTRSATNTDLSVFKIHVL